MTKLTNFSSYNENDMFYNWLIITIIRYYVIIHHLLFLLPISL